MTLNPRGWMRRGCLETGTCGLVFVGVAWGLTLLGDELAPQEVKITEPATLQDLDWNFHAQSTVIGQGHSRFKVRYSGPKSLRSRDEFKETVSLDLSGGLRLWRGAEFHVDGLLWQGFGVSDASGIAGFPNGEAFRLGTEVPNVNLSRVFLQQFIGFGGEQEKVEDSAFELPSFQDVSRLTVKIGKFSAKDVFDGNSYSNDPRTQFMNWSLMANGAWDYPADALGYIPGLTFDLNQPEWAIRYGYFMVPRVANGVALDGDPTRAWSMAGEYERRFKFGARPGAVRFLLYLTRAHMGSYRAAVDTSTLAADIVSTRDYRYKFGFGVNAEQEVCRDLGVFLRAGCNDGRTETWMFTDIDQSLSTGLHLKGAAWRRSDDILGIAGVINGISIEHREFLAVGGTGITTGDGALNYSLEQILEVYYQCRFGNRVRLTFDYQMARHPAYNGDRGMVSLFGVRAHWEY